MFTQKAIFRMFSILLFAVSSLTSIGYARSVDLASKMTGQSDGLLQFTASNHVLGFASSGMYTATGSHVLRVDFMNANNVQPQADSLTGTDEKAVPLQRVSYANLWNGASLTYTSSADGIFSTTYQLEAGADAENIRLLYNAPLTLNPNGTLNIAFDSGSFTESAPIAWQEIQGKCVTVPVAFDVQGQEVGFTLGKYNSNYPVTIDPTLTWNTFLGSSNQDRGNAIAVDGSGNVYVTGESRATWGSPIRAYSLGDDAFVAKLDALTGALIWHTFLGGSSTDTGLSISLDGSGNIYVSGSSQATWGSPVRAYTSAGYDAFVAKLDTNGALQWNTFLGGSSIDQGNSIDVDGSNVYVAGVSQGTWGTPVQAFNASGEAFAAKLDASTGSLTWNTFMGGSGFDDGLDVAVDGSGNVYLVGSSPATWGTPVRAYTAGYDAFAAKLDSNGALTWNTFLGGDQGDFGASIVTDGSGNLYVAGESDSDNGTWGSPVRAFTAGGDAFAAKLDASTGALTWNTFLGGLDADYSGDIVLDEGGNIYIIGFSEGTWGSPLQPFNDGGGDAFIVQLSSSGSLAWNTFLGGSTSNDDGFGIAVDGDKNIYVTGESDANWGTPVRAYTANQLDAFVARLFNSPTVVSITRANPNPTSAASVNFTVTFSEPVTNVTIDDFDLTTTGTISGAAISGGSGGGTTYTITVNTGSGSGTIRLDLIDDDSILSSATSNPLGGTGSGNGGFTTGQIYNVFHTIATLLAPNDGESLLTLRPTFDWSDIGGAVSYNIQISTTNTFDALVLNATTTTSTLVSNKDLPKNTTLFWRVKAKTNTGFDDWSAVRSFITPVNPPPAPVLTLPASKALTTDYTPTFTWKPVIMPAGSLLQNYVIQIDDDADFSSPEAEDDTPVAPTFTPASNLDINANYYWRVRAVNTNDETSNWSAVRYFRTALLPPTLVSPVNGFDSLELRPPFDWADDVNANGYNIQVSLDAAFTQIVHKASAKTSDYVPTKDLPKDTTLYWRVQTKAAKNANGPSDWSEVRSLTTPVDPPPVPILLSPKNNALTTDYTPLFTWKPIVMPLGTNFQNYIIQVDNDSLFGSPEVNDSSITDLNTAQFEPGSALDPNTKYYWRVRAVNTDGELSNWSKVLYFRTAILPPTLLTPADTSTAGSLKPTLDWNDVTGASGYTVQVSLSPTFTTSIIKASTVTSTYTLLKDLPPGTTIYWHVQAKPAGGSHGPSDWSVTFSFVTP